MSPHKPRPAHMTPEQFRELLRVKGYSYADAAEVLQVAKNTVWRWASGNTPISRANANLIRKTIK